MNLPTVQLQLGETKKEVVERSIQNDYQDLDIEDTQMEEGEDIANKR